MVLRPELARTSPSLAPVMMLVAATLATLLAAAPAQASACTGEPPKWCADWKYPNEPFFNCSGSSSLAPAQCDAWQDLYDHNGGANWTDCADARADPCACHGKAHGKQGKGGIVYCKGDHIESIDMMGNGLTGTLNDALSRMPELLMLNMGVNHLDGPLPPFPSTLVELWLGGNKNPAGRHGLTGAIPDLSYMAKLHTLDLALNKLNGTIPLSIAKLKKLRVFYLYNNHLRGKIPALDFAQYSYCGIGNGGPPDQHSGQNRNHWCTPLPHGAKGCNTEGGLCTGGSCYAC
jgi:hypothetical protein